MTDAMREAVMWTAILLMVFVAGIKVGNDKRPLVTIQDCTTGARPL